MQLGHVIIVPFISYRTCQDLLCQYVISAWFVQIYAPVHMLLLERFSSNEILLLVDVGSEFYYDIFQPNYFDYFASMVEVWML